MSHSAEQMRKKAEAMAEAEHHAEHGTVDGSKKRYPTEGMSAKEEYEYYDKSIKTHSADEDSYGEAVHRRVIQDAKGK